jgi:hypothetical protein
VSATSGFLADRAGPGLLAQAAVEGYVTAFWWAAAMFAVGALACGALLRSDARPVLRHGAPDPASSPARA